MSSDLEEIKAAAALLSSEQKEQLLSFVSESLRSGEKSPRKITAFAATHGHSVLDIPSVRLGQVLPSSGADDDLLGEMLEGRV